MNLGRIRRILGPCLGLFIAGTLFSAQADTAGSPSILPGGCLQVIDNDRNLKGDCPLEHTDVTVDISGFLARVTLTQRFGNPFAEPIEAIYTFPMSSRAAVDSMTMRIGDRTIRGVIKEREEAKRIYEAARNAGKAASLLDQERPNIFTQSVANILPGDGIEITISYVEYLKYEDGEYEFSFPMVVGPRYIPGNPPHPGPVVHGTPRPQRPGSDQLPDANRITPPITPEGTRAGHDIALTVNIDSGLAVHDIQSVLHDVEVEQQENRAVVRLKNKTEIPNRDFVLKYTVAGEEVSGAILTHAGNKGGFFTLIVQPPARVAPEAATPKEMIFVIDCSGSMSGFPIEKAKQTMKLCIEGMNPSDTFNLVTFAGGLGYCFDNAVPNTPENRRKALSYLEKLEGGGGTEMMPAIHAALGGKDDPDRLRVVCFMTDAYIGNDMAILDAIQKHAGSARVFSFGIGNSVNRFLIEGMARAGRGDFEIVTLESDADEAAKRFHERIQSPVLTDISVDFGGLNVSEVFPDPGAIPDLFSSKPLILTGRYAGAGAGTITVRGRTASRSYEHAIPVNFPNTEPAHDVLASLWARERIEWLMEQDWKGIQTGSPDKSIKGDITRLGLEFGLVTQFTSFVAVEERVITEGGKPKTVEVPVEMPDGVSYEGIFGNDTAERLAAGNFAYAGQAVVAMSKAGRPAAVRTMASHDELAEAPKASKDDGVHVAPSVSVPADKGTKSEPSKLDPALQGLAEKLVNGAYEEDGVKVKDGRVEVFVYVTDFDADTIKSIKSVGGRFIAERRARQLIHLSVKVEDLDKLAKLTGVTRITPARF